MATATAYLKPSLDQSPNTPPSKYMHALSYYPSPVPPATTIKWGDKIYVLHHQSVSTVNTEIFKRKARRFPPTTMELSQNGFVLGLPNGKIEIWNTNGSKISSHRSLNADESPVNSIDTLGTTILCGSRQLTLFDSRQETEVWSLWDTHSFSIQTVSFASEHLFSSGSPDHFYLWDLRNMARSLGSINISVTSHHWCESRMISSGTDNVVRLWEMTRETFRVYERRVLNCSAVYLTPTCEVALSPNMLYIRSEGKIQSHHTSHEAPPSDISPDKKTIVTQSPSGSLLFFPLA
jgi:hypothetical protein